MICFMYKKLLIIPLFLSSCATYDLNSKRSDNITDNQIKSMKFGQVTNYTISHNNAAARKFAVEESDLKKAFDDGVNANFVKSLNANGSDILDLKLNITTRDAEKEVVPCESSSSASSSGLGWVGALVQVGSALYNANRVCTNDFTYYDVVVNGTKRGTNENLFETKINHKTSLVSQEKRYKELKNIIDRITKYIGVNKAEKV